MKSVCRVVVFACVISLFVPSVLAADFEPDTDGAWVNVDVIDLVDYGDANYLDYLGEGYVAMLDVLKNEGTIIDYGVMMKVFFDENEGSVIIWWSVKSMADWEKAGNRMGEISAEMKTAEEWQALWSKLEKVRKIRSSTLYRSVNWNKIEE
jgi:hypothetical protein